MKFTIIGLGNYGQSLAIELTALGHEVIGADSKATTVDAIKNSIATAYTMDATDIVSLSALPLMSMDVVIVAIGENFGASVKIVALLKKIGVKTIFARAIDDIHKSILESFDISKILTPEHDSATQFVNTIDFGSKVENFSVDGNYHIVKFEIPAKFIGYNINSLKLKEEFDIITIAVTSVKKTKNFLGISVTEHKVENISEIDYKINTGDELVCYGTYKSFHKLWKALL